MSILEDPLAKGPSPSHGPAIHPIDLHGAIEKSGGGTGEIDLPSAEGGLTEIPHHGPLILHHALVPGCSGLAVVGGEVHEPDDFEAVLFQRLDVSAQREPMKPRPAFPTGSARIPPARASSSTPNTSPSAPTCPPRGRTSSTSPTTPAGVSRRSSASPGRRSTKPAASIRLSPGRSKTLVGRILPISPPIADALARRRARRDPGSPLVFHRDGIPIRRWRTAWRTACQSAGVPTRFLHDCRRTAARNLIRANVPERVAMLLTGHKSRAIFDRYNIINEQELLDAGDQLVEYLAQQAQAVPARQRPHPAGPAAPRTASPLRLVRRGTA